MLTPAGFRRTIELLPDPTLVLTPAGIVLELNGSCCRLLGQQRSALRGRSLEHHVESREALSRFLESCSRSAAGVPGKLRVRNLDHPLEVWGGLVEADVDRGPTVLLVRVKGKDENRFVVLNRQLHQLNQEIETRTVIERRLREQEAALAEQLQIAAFGRDVALAVTQSTDIDTMLRCCAQSMVDHLGAAFARLWILDPETDSLRLRASAGLYTHLDGAHREIPVGEFKIGRIAESHEPHLTNQVIGDPAVHDQEWAQREAMRSFAGYPLLVQGRMLGVMAMFSRQELSETTTLALGSVAGALAMGVDRVQIESELRASVEALRLADQGKDEFLAMLSHELRAPLAPMRHALEILQRGELRPDLIQVLDEQLNHSVRLVDDLLDISRVSRGKIAIQLETLTIEELIAEAERTSRRLFEERGQSLRTQIGDEGPFLVEGDRVRLRQVLLNLLQNAAKYTPEGGNIEVRVGRAGDSVEVSVEDDGMGIDAPFLAEMFDLFAQSERTLDRRDGGLGLGLTLARTLVEGHGGEIEASSPGVGQGSTITFRLPSSEGGGAAPLPPPEQKAGAQPPLTGRRALVVDDSEVTADTLRELLGIMGCASVDVAYDGERALAHAKGNRYDLAVLDIGLPGLNGYRLAEKLRALDGTSGAMLVALTGYGSEKDRLRSQEAGFDAHLVKPLDLAALEQLFEDFGRAGTGEESS